MRATLDRVVHAEPEYEELRRRRWRDWLPPRIAVPLAVIAASAVVLFGLTRAVPLGWVTYQDPGAAFAVAYPARAMVVQTPGAVRFQIPGTDTELLVQTFPRSDLDATATAYGEGFATSEMTNSLVSEYAWPSVDGFASVAFRAVNVTTGAETIAVFVDGPDGVVMVDGFADGVVDEGLLATFLRSVDLR